LFFGDTWPPYRGRPSRQANDQRDFPSFAVLDQRPNDRRHRSQ
jgi:hypothetical protein